MPFNLKRAIAQAEGGDAALWEDIARHLIAEKAKPKKVSSRKASAGPQTWARVSLGNGRTYLTSCYSKITPQATIPLQRSVR